VRDLAGTKLLYSDLETNGIVYLNFYFPMAAVAQEDLPYAYLLAEMEPGLKQMLTVRRPSFNRKLKLRLLQKLHMRACLPSARDARLAKIGPTPGDAQ